MTRSPTRSLARRLVTSAALGVAYLVTAAHVGSPDVVTVGRAGAYPLQVVVRAPDVIPGRAEITVQVDTAGAAHVYVQPVLWSLGVKGAPRPDEMSLVPGEARLYTSQLWLMTSGSYSVRVIVDGALGEGTMFVPVSAVARKQLPLSHGTAVMLAGLGIFLVVGMASIAWSATRESTLPPGEMPNSTQARHARLAATTTLVVLVLALVGGKRWWDGEEASFRRTLDRPWRVRASVAPTNDGRALTVAIVDSDWTSRRTTPIVPDHGKLMHLFLVRLPAADAFVHLHPLRADSSTFRAALPAIPAGRYAMYADIVHASGFARTLTDTVEIPDGAPSSSAARDDPDLSGTFTGEPSALATNGVARFDDGRTMTLQPTSVIRAKRPIDLRVTLADANGAAAALEPYMGMAGHAVIRRDDGAVFVHLHPMGTISMAAQRTFERRAAGDTTLVRDDTTAAMQMTMQNPVTFPYEFPSAGKYRVWVQVKTKGRVRTGVFDVDVKP